jgi:hypothetical protein
LEKGEVEEEMRLESDSGFRKSVEVVDYENILVNNQGTGLSIIGSGYEEEFRMKGFIELND